MDVELRGPAYRMSKLDLGSRVFRLVLLIPLAASALVTAYLSNVPHRSVADFTRAVQQHRVTYVGVRGTDGEANQKAVWSSGWFDWATTSAVDTPSGSPAGLREISEGTDAVANGTAFSTWSLHNLQGFGRGAAVVCGLLTLCLMLGEGGAFVGNRWFWFWMFITPAVGALSMPLFLLLERQPLWERGPRQMPAKAPRGGFYGCLLAFLIGVVLSVGGTLLANSLA